MGLNKFQILEEEEPQTSISYMCQDTICECQGKEMKANPTYKSELKAGQPRIVSTIGGKTKPRPANTLTITRFSDDSLPTIDI